jgi:formyltetrahydrofolate deformylase
MTDGRVCGYHFGHPFKTQCVHTGATENASMKPTAVLLISCPDQKGLVAAIANFLLTYNANIVHADQHQDAELKLFLMRVEWDVDDFSLPLDDFAAAFAPIAVKHQMTWRLAVSSRKLRMGILVSKLDHCLADLLYRYQSGELRCEIPIILSNHEDTRWLANTYGVPFQHMPVNKDNRTEAEPIQTAILRDLEVDFIVLARYMQVLSPHFIQHYPNRIINIHHSFLPAFHGAKPYHRAFERGVKLIGATSHYVTEALDDGPIIEQDVARISHRDSLEDLIHKGADLEKIVLSRAVKWHIDNRVLVYANKTVVFD